MSDHRAGHSRSKQEDLLEPQLVTTDVLHGPEAEQYFTNADRRIMTGLRAACAYLGIPAPAYAQRRTPGPTPTNGVRAAFRADHPTPFSTALAPRKPNASAETVAAAMLRSGA